MAQSVGRWRSLADFDEHDLQLVVRTDTVGLQQEGRLVGVVPNDVVVHPDQDAASGQTEQTYTPQHSQSFKRRGLDGWIDGGPDT